MNLLSLIPVAHAQTVQMTVEEFCTAQHHLLGLSNFWMIATIFFLVAFIVFLVKEAHPALSITFLILTMISFIIGFYYLVEAPKFPTSAATYCTHEYFPELY